MTAEQLSTADRELAQLALMRIWLGRQRRARWEITHGHRVPVKRFDLHGRRIDGSPAQGREARRRA